MSGTKPETYWVAQCWGRLLAGPDPSGPPWLFVTSAHAEQYAAQLRAQGVDAKAREFVPANGTPILEWKGQGLLQVPAIPPPSLTAASVTTPPPGPATTETEHPPANGTPLAPPPNVE